VLDSNYHLPLVAPRVTPPLDLAFRPAVLANHAFKAAVRSASARIPVKLAIEQADGNISHFASELFAENTPESAGNFIFLERTLKLLLWSRGGYRIHFNGPADLAERLQAYYRQTPTGQFDSHIVGERMFDHPLEVVRVTELPPEKKKRGRARPAPGRLPHRI